MGSNHFPLFLEDTHTRDLVKLRSSSPPAFGMHRRDADRWIHLHLPSFPSPQGAILLLPIICLDGDGNQLKGEAIVLRPYSNSALNLPKARGPCSFHRPAALLALPVAS